MLLFGRAERGEREEWVSEPCTCPQIHTLQLTASCVPTPNPSSEVEVAIIEGVECRSVYGAKQSSSEEGETKRRKEAECAEQDDRVLALLFRKGGEMSSGAGACVSFPTCVQWNLFIVDTIGTQVAVLYREVSLI